MVATVAVYVASPITGDVVAAAVINERAWKVTVRSGEVNSVVSIRPLSFPSTQAVTTTETVVKPVFASRRTLSLVTVFMFVSTTKVPSVADLRPPTGAAN